MWNLTIIWVKIRCGHLKVSVQSKSINVMLTILTKSLSPELCNVAKPILSFSHSHRFPMLHLPMRNSLQNGHHHHLILHERKQVPSEMLKWFPLYFCLNLIWTFNVLFQNAVEMVYTISNNKLSIKFLTILIEEMIKNTKMEKLYQ